MLKTVHTLDNQEVIEALQQDAVEIHKQHVFMTNNKPDVITRDYIEADLDFKYILGSIEHQINQLFI